MSTKQPATRKRRAPAPARKPTQAAASSRSSRPRVAKKSAAPNLWELRLYVAGQTPKSLAAFSNLKRLCEEHLPGRYRIDVIDLTKNPALAQTDQIVALPTLVRKLPMPIRRIIGDLSNLERVLVGMELRPS